MSKLSELMVERDRLDRECRQLKERIEELEQRVKDLEQQGLATDNRREE